MIHPNRTSLLQQKEKQRAVRSSLNILKARRQALVQEFMKSARPFLDSRQEIARLYRQALAELAISLDLEGGDMLASIVAAGRPEVGVSLREGNILGVRYQEVEIGQPLMRRADARQYDLWATTPHLEEAIDLFERLAADMLQLAVFENKLKKLGDNIKKVTRKTRVLEERILPEIQQRIHLVSQYLNEREREDRYRLKRFKGGRRNEQSGSATF